ncbi:peroxide/acid stress response protein YhcN [Rahnella sp. BCC 1045]|uniref:peroxide/acid stress response protein YhcN n=1 Tax=Rahnella sp. BCC 1045 TaxID=2816251 RepID=UPI001C26B902|nr:peroxide/acid stress response protein YhcN [Rahnella sp. BCC 1045]MBU9822266.1 peroxide/acid stress response protein YhcN [Rahnella sp. BCC 1045]
MKIMTTIAALSLLSAVSFGAPAAQLVSNQQAENLQPMGTISVSGVNGVPTDIRQELSDKADSKGAKSYRVIEAHNDGAYHATAEIYQ